MKFGDKLILLRKKNGMNQEELAEKLGVSRQSVSKWESNNAYPETDKIVQICNIFNCSMDDLINDSITDINEIQRKDKNNFSVAMDSFLEFVTKSINMFSNMKFTSGLKCLIEMIILALILALVGNIFSGILSSCIANVFTYAKVQNIIESIFYSIFMLIWVIIEIIILIHTFKIRYLDYYDKVSNEEEKKEENDEVKNEEKVNMKRTDKVIIRDKDHKPFAFLSVLSSIIIFFAKLILACFALEFIAILVSSAVALVFSIFLTPTSTIFLGADISLISFIIINVILLIFIISFIFNKKVKYKPLLISFLLSPVFIGVGIGISVISFKSFEIVDETKYNTTKEEKIDYTDNLITVIEGLHDTEYEIDNSVDGIKVELSYDNRIINYKIEKDTYYGLNTYEVHGESVSISPKKMYDIIIPDLKKKIIRTSYASIKMKVVANEEVINKLIENASKVYVFDMDQTDNGYILKNMSHKILKEDYCTEKTDYNAVTGEITTSGSCKCTTSENGAYLRLNCGYEE